MHLNSKLINCLYSQIYLDRRIITKQIYYALCEVPNPCFFKTMSNFLTMSHFTFRFLIVDLAG